eukprot:PhM_4_TR13024/c0_g1_i1/m.36512/K02920/RP-L36e, RPL36; large subunit ribosomal protein L36e
MVRASIAPKNASGMGVITGLKKGFQVTKRNLTQTQHKDGDRVFTYTKAKNKRNRPHKAKWAMQAVIRDVVGTLPFERRAQELLKIGREKKALKFCKRRLGSFAGAKKKREALAEALRTKKK